MTVCACPRDAAGCLATPDRRHLEGCNARGRSYEERKARGAVPSYEQRKAKGRSFGRILMRVPEDVARVIRRARDEGRERELVAAVLEFERRTWPE